MNLKQALQRIEELEKRVKELEARPVEQHFHFPQAPLYPQYVPIPMYPQPWSPWYVTSGSGFITDCTTTTTFQA